MPFQRSYHGSLGRHFSTEQPGGASIEDPYKLVEADLSTLCDDIKLVNYQVMLNQDVGYQISRM